MRLYQASEALAVVVAYLTETGRSLPASVKLWSAGTHTRQMLLVMEEEEVEGVDKLEEANEGHSYGSFG